MSKVGYEIAPVLVSVYDRLTHLMQCVDSLKENPMSSETELYIVSDAAATAGRAGEIQAIRDYIMAISGFKRVIPLINPVNKGSFESIRTGIDVVLQKHERMIFLEDDNVVSKNFLGYINDGLEFYASDKSVFSISGYAYPVKIPVNYEHDVYKWQGFTAWGVGLWRDRWERIAWSPNWVSSFLADPVSVRRMNSVAEHVVHFYETFPGGSLPQIADGIISMNLVESDMYTLFPVVSRVRNIGCDGTGEHGTSNRIYSTQEIDVDSSYTFVRDLQPDNRINQILRTHFKIPFKRKLVDSLPRQVRRHMRILLGRSSSEHFPA
jgi:hypothetical protein